MAQIGFRRILCASDFSLASLPAWVFAQRLARATGGELTLLHVVAPIPVPLELAVDVEGYQQLADAEREAARVRGQQQLEGAIPGVRATLRIEDGPAAARILKAVDEGATDAVVLGTHGRTGLDRLLLGSVAEQVIRLARRPVVTARLVPTPPAPEEPIRRIVYPTDFSPPARRAWAWVRALAEATGAHVDLLHVLLEVVPDRHVDPAFLARAAATIRRDALRVTDAFVESCGLPTDRISVQLLHGVEAEQIVHAARSSRADLIVMGTHGRSGFLQLALGSVARRVLHGAPCPVMTVGPEVPA